MVANYKPHRIAGTRCDYSVAPISALKAYHDTLETYVRGGVIPPESLDQAREKADEAYTDAEGGLSGLPSGEDVIEKKAHSPECAGVPQCGARNCLGW